MDNIIWFLPDLINFIIGLTTVDYFTFKGEGMEKISKIELNQILNLHKEWIDSGFKRGKQANLSGANLFDANLFDANLSNANLSNANLYGATLFGANLFDANLYGANLSNANLSGANLSGANLCRAYLSGVDLSDAKYSIKNLLRINWKKLSDKMTLELMRHDAQYISIESMNTWKETGKCPYINMERDFYFEEERSLWKPGLPKIRGIKLFKALCKETNITITI